VLRHHGVIWQVVAKTGQVIVENVNIKVR